MASQAPFNLQGHRGARGLKPENTLPSFEVALDFGVTSIETDVHLTRDGVPILSHEPCVSELLCYPLPGSTSPAPESRPLLSSLDLAQCRDYRADRNPCPLRFPEQNAQAAPAAKLFAEQSGIDPYTLPTLAELIAFIAAYAGDLGAQAGKSAAQRAKAARALLDLELKRVPFRPQIIGDEFDGEAPGEFESRVVDDLKRGGVLGRTIVRSFDHASIRALRSLEPSSATAVLVAGTAPLDPVSLVQRAGAQLYCPDFLFLREAHVKQARDAGLRVIPWTVNDPSDWERLLAWQVNGITTDYPDRLAEWLRRRGIVY
jgi:glycerophosphoryl diester phosphodiesterase